jgi:hypothetical protein
MECQHDDSLLDEFKTINYCICWNNRKGTFGLTGIYSDWQQKKEREVRRTWGQHKIDRIEEIVTLLCVKFGTDLCSQRDVELVRKIEL